MQSTRHLLTDSHQSMMNAAEERECAIPTYIDKKQTPERLFHRDFLQNPSS